MTYVRNAVGNDLTACVFRFVRNIQGENAVQAVHLDIRTYVDLLGFAAAYRIVVILNRPIQAGHIYYLLLNYPIKGRRGCSKRIPSVRLIAYDCRRSVAARMNLGFILRGGNRKVGFLTYELYGERATVVNEVAERDTRHCVRGMTRVVPGNLLPLRSVPNGVLRGRARIRMGVQPINLAFVQVALFDFEIEQRVAENVLYTR